MFPLMLILVPVALGSPCATNEILLRNRTCHCPFLKFNNQCLRKRYQTTFNGTLSDLALSTRHLLSTQPSLLTVDASNEEAMFALAASLQAIRSIGTVVTRVVDATDTLIGGDASATLEIVNVTIDTTHSRLALTIDCRYPLVDYFYLYMHLGAAIPPCPPFDPSNRCCRGDMGSAEFVTATDVDCTSDDPFAALDRFVHAWGGEYLSQNKQTLTLSVDLSQPGIPTVIEAGARVYRLGVGMVVFGRLAQNTEARLQLVLNSSSVATTFGAFQYSYVEFSRLQLEACGNLTYAHLIIKASLVESVQNLRFQTWDGGNWAVPNCSDSTVVPFGSLTLGACNVTITPELVDIYMSMQGVAINSTTAVYVLLQRGPVLTRVVAKTDDAVLNHCNAPISVDASGYEAFTVKVTQGSSVLYTGPPQPVQLTEVAAITIRLISNSAMYRYTIENVSVIYSLVEASRILPLMPDGRVTPALEQLCDEGSICIIEELLINGVCQTGEKCETQGDSLFLMPLYPWGGASMKQGAYTVLTADIREALVPTGKNGTSLVRRLLSWLTP